MRTLVVIAEDQYVRNIIASGALGRLEEDDETYYVTSRRGVRDPGSLRERPGWVGEIEEPEWRVQRYLNLRWVLLASYRFRSRTLRIRVGNLTPAWRFVYKLGALPGMRQLVTRLFLALTGRNRSLHRTLEEVRPDLVIAPSGGTDTLVFDVIRSARSLGIPSLVLVYNWDNLSSKGAFPIHPDYLAVPGQQSVEHARRIHGIDSDRVFPLGSPYIDNYFRHEPGSTESPFPFPYALFAGCLLPFDELTALERLEQTIEEQELDLKVVYRPHPHRRPRLGPDLVDESRFKHVVIDPQVREQYLATFEAGSRGQAARMPSLSYYPALLEHCRFVVCPLSTMIVEAAIFQRRVGVIAYDDGVHQESPATIFHFDHFEGIEAIDGFEICKTPGELSEVFAKLATSRRRFLRSMRGQIRDWLYFDDRTYGERLGEAIDEVARREGIEVGVEAAQPGPQSPARARIAR